MTSKDLRSEFPNLAESIYVDIIRSEPDPAKARTILQSLQSNDPDAKQLERMLEDLQQFAELGRETIVACLREKNWQPEAAVLPLFTKLEMKRNIESEKKRKAHQEEARAKARAHANKFLRDLFTSVPEERIQQLLVERDGDVDACIEALLSIQRKKEQEEVETQKKIQREDKIGSLAYKFEKSKAEVTALLENYNWDFEKAIDQLVKDSQETKFVNICKKYHNRDPMQIRYALERADYDEVKAIINIEETIEQEKKIREAKEKEIAARELAKKLAEEATKKAKEAEIAALKAAQEESSKKEAEIKAAAAKEAEKRKQEAEQHHKIRLDESHFIERQVEKQKSISNEEIQEANVVRTRKVMEFISDNDPVKMRDAEVLTVLQQIVHDIGTDALANPIATNPVSESNETPVANEAKTTPNVQVVTLAPSAKAFDHGETITVSWSFADEALPSDTGLIVPGTNDWIALYREGATNKNYSWWQWTSAYPGRSISLPAPAAPGIYVFRYFVNRGFTVVGSSSSFTVGPTFTLTPSVIDKTVVKIAIEQTFGKSCPNSWLGLYDPSKTNNSYITYENVGDKKEISFKVPKAGVWEFRLFPQRGYDMVAGCKADVNGETRLNITLTADSVVVSYNISALDPAVDKVWFGIYHVEEKNNRSYRRFKYLSSTSGTLNVNVMKTPGTYEARLFAHGDMAAVICRSNLVTIPTNEKIV